MDFHRKWMFQDETKKTWKAELPTLKNKKIEHSENLEKSNFFQKSPILKLSILFSIFYVTFRIGGGYPSKDEGNIDFHQKWTFQDETKKTWKAELPTLKNKKMRAFSNLGRIFFGNILTFLSTPEIRQRDVEGQLVGRKVNQQACQGSVSFTCQDQIWEAAFQAKMSCCLWLSSAP